MPVKMPELSETGLPAGRQANWPAAMVPASTWPLPPADTNATSFAAGTRICTMRGEIPVESIVVGDLVVIARDGGPGTRKVVGTGKRAVDITRHPQPEMVLPIRITAGSIDAGLPIRDLRLFPQHAVYMDGVLIEARNLVNGATVLQECGTTHVTYHWIELDQHDVLLADGLPAAGSLGDTGGAPAAGAATAAPPRAAGPQVEAARNRLRARAAALGFADDEKTAEPAPGLIARAGGRTVARVPHGDMLAFLLPAGTETVELISPGLPGTQRPGAVFDPAITGLTLVAEGRRIAITPAAECGNERHGSQHRTTDHAAWFILPEHDGPAILEIATAASA